MERKRGIVIGVIIAVIISIISIGVTFAAFSSTLTINGNGTISGSKWDVHFSTTEGGNAPTGDGASITPTATTGGAISSSAVLTAGNFSWSGIFKEPGSSLEYRFYVVNKGDYDAVLSGTFTSNVSCLINNAVQSTCPITYTVTKDGTNKFANNDSLNKSQSQLVIVKAQLDPNFAVTNDDITVNTTQIVFTYTQKTE